MFLRRRGKRASERRSGRAHARTRTAAGVGQPIKQASDSPPPPPSSRVDASSASFDGNVERSRPYRRQRHRRYRRCHRRAAADGDDQPRSRRPNGSRHASPRTAPVLELARMVRQRQAAAAAAARHRAWQAVVLLCAGARARARLRHRLSALESVSRDASPPPSWLRLLVRRGAMANGDASCACRLAVRS